MPSTILGAAAGVLLLLVGVTTAFGSSNTAAGLEMSVIDIGSSDCDPLDESLDEEAAGLCAMGSVMGGYAVVFRNNGDGPVDITGDEIWMVGQNGKTYSGQSTFGGTCTVNPGKLCDFAMVFPGGEDAAEIGVTTSTGEVSVSSDDFGGQEEFLELLRESAGG